MGELMFYDDDAEKGEEKDSQLCEWCYTREAEEERLIFGLGRLRLCGECATMLLASLMDSG
jgi:hypothetical protein